MNKKNDNGLGFSIISFLIFLVTYSLFFYVIVVVNFIEYGQDAWSMIFITGLLTSFLFFIPFLLSVILSLLSIKKYKSCKSEIKPFRKILHILNYISLIIIILTILFFILYAIFIELFYA